MIKETEKLVNCCDCGNEYATKSGHECDWNDATPSSEPHVCSRFTPSPLARIAAVLERSSLKKGFIYSCGCGAVDGHSCSCPANLQRVICPHCDCEFGLDEGA